MDVANLRYSLTASPGLEVNLKGLLQRIKPDSYSSTAQPWEQGFTRQAGRALSCDSRLHRGRAPSAAAASPTPCPALLSTQGCPHPRHHSRDAGAAPVCLSPALLQQSWARSFGLQLRGCMPQGCWVLSSPYQILQPRSPREAQPWHSECLLCMTNPAPSSCSCGLLHS